MQVDEIELSGKPFVAAYDHWRKICGAGRRFPRPQDLDPVEMPRPILGSSELVEVLTEPLDFRYRLIGTAIYEISQSNYTGLTVRQIPTQAPPSRMFDFFALAYERKTPLCARLPYEGPDEFVETIRNLLLPLGDGAGKILMFWSVVEIGRRQIGATNSTN